MATNITVYDLEHYPDNGKTVTVDLKSIVPLGYGGDNKWCLSADTSATASGSTTIQESFVNGTIVGWSKASSRVSSPFTISSSNNQLKVAIDEPLASGVTITLTVSATPLTGDSVAADIETQIRNTTITGGAKAGNLAYLNAHCVFRNGRFIISSGSLASTFTGTDRSSVRVGAAASNDASDTLGFDTPIESEEIASATLTETYTSSLVSASTTVPVASVSGFTAGECIAIKDPDGSIYYRYIDTVNASDFTVNTAVSCAANSLIQQLRLQDPELKPPSYHQDVDGPARHAIELIARQINFA